MFWIKNRGQFRIWNNNVKSHTPSKIRESVPKWVQSKSTTLTDLVTFLTLGHAHLNADGVLKPQHYQNTYISLYKIGCKKAIILICSLTPKTFDYV